MSIKDNLKKLVAYGLATGLIEPEDKIYTTNRLLELFELDELEDNGCGDGGHKDGECENSGCKEDRCEGKNCESDSIVAGLESVLSEMLDYANSLTDELNKIPELASTSILGDQKEEIAILLDFNKLSAYGVSISSLMANFQTAEIGRASCRERV